MSDSEEDVPEAVVFKGVEGDIQAPQADTAFAGGEETLAVPVTLITGKGLSCVLCRRTEKRTEHAVKHRLSWGWKDYTRQPHPDSQARLSDSCPAQRLWREYRHRVVSPSPGVQGTVQVSTAPPSLQEFVAYQEHSQWQPIGAKFMSDEGQFVMHERREHEA